MSIGSNRRITRPIARVAIIASTTVTILLGGGAPAHAAGYWYVDLNVQRNGGATMTVVDTLNPSTTYAITLAASGGGTCTLAAGQSLIADAGYDLGPAPATASTQGSCNIYNGAVTYEMTWAPVGGSPGHLEVQCVWLLGPVTPVCTVSHLQGTMVSGLPV